MKKQRTFQHPNKIGMKDSFGYGLGDAANLFVLTYVSSYLKVFYTDVLKVAESKITTLLLISRLWDAINDPLWGAIVAKRRPGKGGKFRPYLKWCAIPLGITSILCFVNFRDFTTNEAIVLALMYASYIGFGMMYTGMNIPYGSLASVITDDPEGRTLLSTMRSVGAGLGGAIPLLIGPMIIYTVVGTNAQGNPIKAANAGGMMKFGVIMGMLSIIFYFLCFATTKERVASEAEPRVDIKQTYLGMLKSKPFVIAAISGILISGQLQFNSLNQYLYKNYFENTDLSIIGTVATYLPMAVMILFTPKLVKKYGKKELCTIGTLLSAIASILMFIIVPRCDRLGNASVVFMLFLFVIGFGYSFVSITNWAVITDVIDYQEHKTGIRSESAVYAVYTFCRKLGQTIADVGGMKMLSSVAGYDGAVHGSAGYVEGVGEGILFVCTVIPAIVYTLVFVLFVLYPLNKSMLEIMYGDLTKKRTVAF